jgi:surface antigen
MAWRLVVLLSTLLLAACGGGRLAGEASGLECAPFARAATGIALYGDAADWWEQAAGRYGRSSEPVPGGVLVFARSGRLPAGHVAVVRALVSAREIRVDQANWVHHRITRDEPVIDVSAANDWSAVRVWWAPVDALGASVYQTYGFITP